jgi:hypothetical protein
MDENTNPDAQDDALGDDAGEATEGVIEPTPDGVIEPTPDGEPAEAGDTETEPEAAPEG